MCELLVRSVSKTHPDDPYLCSKLTKRGDVIVAMPDGWGWGTAELANPEWVILKMPAVPLEFGQSFLGEEKNTDPSNPSYVLQRRAFYLDLDALLQTGDLSSLNDAQLAEYKRRKAPLEDPNILG